MREKNEKSEQKIAPRAKLRLAVLCGGPSPERGISLNSARSACDHLDSEDLEVVPIYFDHRKNPYHISRAQLYSNTPSDFDFKLHATARPLSPSAFTKLLRSVDCALPLMHGRFGEDGGIQRILESLRIPFIGSSSAACADAFDKYAASDRLMRSGFPTIPAFLVKAHVNMNKKEIADFFSENKITAAVVKPARCGSSIGVSVVNSLAEAVKSLRELFAKRIDTRAVIQPFVRGVEFTVIVVQNRFGNPVALLPTEIEVDYLKHGIFDYRKKYLPTHHVSYHCPPRFARAQIERIQEEAQHIFTLFCLRDFARFDGWILKNGEVVFSDLNPVSGMEQNSFLFQQGTQLGFSHRSFLRMLVENACRREGIAWKPSGGNNMRRHRARISVLFGGTTAERQVSVMTGTNVWLKLRRFPEYDVQPFLLGPKNRVWHLPYHLALNHTAEEILAASIRARGSKKLLAELRRIVLLRLAPDRLHRTEKLFMPTSASLKAFLRKSEFIFIGLHGGMGENGELQKMLEVAHKPFNGPDSAASRLCMDKFKTARVLDGLEEEGIFAASQKLVSIDTFRGWLAADYLRFWRRLKKELGAQSIIVKPHDDGCSAGVARLFEACDLAAYVEYAQSGKTPMPLRTLSKQHAIIEMPTKRMHHLLFEKFVETDAVYVARNRLIWKKRSGWIEVTVGVFGEKGRMRAMNPSLTVASGHVLSLEEKFQGGTGINITPPPLSYVSPRVKELARKRIKRVADILGLEGYSRIDAFLNIRTGAICVIEVNTLPALTPSTVIFHQALAEEPKMYPSQFLRLLVQKGFDRASRHKIMR